ncbi:hypothetical protein HNO89_002678 [Sporosarcina luteola]|nr:hypothetical protein [Sporosarcina luteola]
MNWLFGDSLETLALDSVNWSATDGIEKTPAILPAGAS